MQAVADAAGATAWVGVRAPPGRGHGTAHDALAPSFGAMAFDIDAGIYWRPEEGGLLWGMSNPDEVPGPGRTIDWPYLKRMQRRLARLVPVTAELGIKKAWAATIEYTPDHLPLLGPLVLRDGTEVGGVTIASSCGHGMMWGPAVARIATDLALTAPPTSSTSEDFRMDRFDEQRRFAVRRSGGAAVPGPRGRRLTTPRDHVTGQGASSGTWR